MDGEEYYSTPMRLPPHNLEAEKGLLGAILLNNRAHERVSETLRPEHFSYERHGKIYDAISRVIERGQVADGITLQRFFENDQSLADIGGPAYLGELTAAAASVRNAEEYGRIVRDLFYRRELINVCSNTLDTAFDDDLEATADTLIEGHEASLLAVVGDKQTGSGPVHVSKFMRAAIEEAQAARLGQSGGVTSGFADLDGKAGGFFPSDLIIIAGRPSMGKTALAANIAFNAARKFIDSNGTDGSPTAFFSLEMSGTQLATREAAARCGFSSHKVRTGAMDDNDLDRLNRAVETLNAYPVFIDDTPALTVPAIRARARRLVKREKVGLILIDYLQLITPARRNDGRVNEVSEITRSLKALAKELNVPVIALSQLSRNVETREPPRPQLSDLRESGSIEQDADVVMFVYREAYYLERQLEGAPPTDNRALAKWQLKTERLEAIQKLAEVMLAKQRHGPIGTVKLHFEGETTKFSNWSNRQGGPY